MVNNYSIHYNDEGVEVRKKGIGNDPFDLLYYLCWLNENNSPGIKKGDILSDKQKSAIYLKYKFHKRFDGVWADGDKDQIEKKKSIVNNYFNFNLIIKKSTYFCLNDKLSRELKPYPSD